jgi:hypothetical protein
MVSDAQVMDLLVLWHRSEARWLPVESYPAVCPSCSGYRASRQYDSNNGASESEALARLVNHVSHVISGIQEPHQTALRFLARNRASGASVWSSPRLPESQDELEALTAEAVELFTAAVC